MNALRRYSYLGPPGTFTEAALSQVSEAKDQHWHSVGSVAEALDNVTSGHSFAAMIAMENSVDGGVGATQDALARRRGLRIIGEYLVPVNFSLVARPGTLLSDVAVVNAHPVAYAQCGRWLHEHLPQHGHIPASSNVTAASSLLDGSTADAAIASPAVTGHYVLDVLAENIGDDARAVTRFVLVSQQGSIPERTGADKTSLIVELPNDNTGALLEMLEQFSTRRVNLSLIQSRPIGDALGRYRFIIDVDGHVAEERVADALLGLRRSNPNVLFLGSYPRADKKTVDLPTGYEDSVFVEARAWLADLTNPS